MPPDAVALYATVILLLPMVCFFLASPTFLLVGLEVPEVTQLLRAIFHGYFLAIGIAGIIAMVLFVVSGRPVFVAGAVRQLRVLHLKGMLINAAQLAIVIASVPLVV